MKKIRSLCLTAAGMSIFLTFLSGCQFLANDLKDKQIQGQKTVYDPNSVLGSSAHALVSNENFRSVLIEIQSVEGLAPSPDTTNHLRGFLEKYLKKNRSIEIILNDPIPSPGIPQSSIQDARRIEEKNRRHFTRKDQVVIYVLLLDGKASDSTAALQTLGRAYRNTSIVLYGSTIREIAAQQNVPLWAVETTILEHEIGHTMGLVNLLPKMRKDHIAGNHCSNERCLMNATVETPAILSQLQNGPPGLDSDCENELQEIAKASR